MDLLQHLIFNHLAPDALDLVIPVRTDGSEFEQFSTCEQTEDVLLHHGTRHAFDSHSGSHIHQGKVACTPTGSTGKHWMHQAEVSGHCLLSH